MGFVAAWDIKIDSVGVGEQEIKKIVEGERIDFELRFIKPFEATEPAFMVTEAVSENQTKVKWGFSGHMDYPMNLMMLFMYFEKMIGDDLQTGLKNLKNQIRKVMTKKYKIEIKWAFIFMGASLFWMFLEKWSGLHSTHIDKHQYLTMLYMIPAIWIFVLALKDKKKSFYEGQMSFKQGFVSGLVITVIVTVFSPLSQWIISNLITPEYFKNVIAYSVKTGYHKTLGEAEAFFNYKNFAIQSTIWALIMGVFTSAIVAFFVKSKTSE